MPRRWRGRSCSTMGGGACEGEKEELQVWLSSDASAAAILCASLYMQSKEEKKLNHTATHAPSIHEDKGRELACSTSTTRGRRCPPAAAARGRRRRRQEVVVRACLRPPAAAAAKQPPREAAAVHPRRRRRAATTRGRRRSPTAAPRDAAPLRLLRCPLIVMASTHLRSPPPLRRSEPRRRAASTSCTRE